MRVRLICQGLLIMGLSAGAALAATQPAPMTRQALVTSDGLPRTSVGVGIDLIERGIRPDNRAQGMLEGTAYYGSLGYDLRGWLTLFGTAGIIQLDQFPTSGAGTEFDSDLRWSVGLKANLWHLDLKNPEYLRGRVSIGLLGEYTRYRTASGSTDLEWTDTVLMLPVGYEIPNEPMSFWGVHSLYLFAGPVWSVIDGTIKPAASARTDFEAADETGAVAGLEIFAAPNLSIGAHGLYLHDLSVTIGLHYHFY